MRQDGAREMFAMQDGGGWLEGTTAIPEPHAFVATVHVGG